jgi:hypothetical protein
LDFRHVTLRRAQPEIRGIQAAEIATKGYTANFLLAADAQTFQLPSGNGFQSRCRRREDLKGVMG